MTEGMEAKRRPWRHAISKPRPRVDRIALWISAASLVLLVLGSLSAHGGGSFLCGMICLCLDLPFLLFLLLRVLNRHLLWKVRNRLIMTYVLMGLAPVVLFVTLTAITDYILAGQYAINSALSALDDAQQQLRAETASVANILVSPDRKATSEPLVFDQASNAREAENAVAVLHAGTWHTVPLVTRRGGTPPSPLDGKPNPMWLPSGYQGMVLLNGKLYLSHVTTTVENGRTAEVAGTLELNHATLNSMSTSLGRILLYSGFAFRSGGLDDAEDTAQRAEDAADRAQDAREQARDAEQEAREATRDADENLRDAQREVQGAHRDAARAHDPDEQRKAQQSLQEAQRTLEETQRQVQKTEQFAQEKLPSISPPNPPQTTVPRPPFSPGASTNHGQGGSPDGAQPSIHADTQEQDFTAVSGGRVPAAAFLLDPRVYFTAPLPVVVWSSSATRPAMLVVISRPSLLYTRLFSTSVRMGSVLRTMLLAIILLFALLEILALWMATRLSSTITESVAGLSQGTAEIDNGNLAYRIQPRRQDELGALATSFNRMAGSIEELLVQQREKERLLSELAIAQEVQRNLFPASPAAVSGLQLHAVCVPARSVSGDYVDFIFEAKATLRVGTTTCIALGDISGKGMSAALLMATLHSAVRAFGLGEEDISSPARMLDLLNRHLLQSTSAEKYATLFIAFYHSATQTLTYSNGGQLPPLILGADGGMRSLEVGGSVIGLLPGLTFEEQTVQLNPGDLFVAYSDGITEPENEENQEDFGVGRLMTIVEAHRESALPIITENVFRAVNQWIGDNEQPDDMTLLLARQM